MARRRRSREWGHVRLFSPWPELVDQGCRPTARAVRLVSAAVGVPDGSRVDRPLPRPASGRARRPRPLRGASDGGVAEGPGPARRRRTRGASRSPCTSPSVDGGESRLEARAVIDASGTWRQPNPAGADGLPALGERAAASLIRYQVPDFAAPGPFAGKHTVVLGAGHSAATAVIELARIAEAYPGTVVTWVLRRGVTSAKPSAAGPPTSCPHGARSASARGRPWKTASSAW